MIWGCLCTPARLRATQAAASQDKNSPEYQRITWDALRKSITGIVNRVNIANIKQISENLIRGRGLFARSMMKAQAASLPFTPVFAALVAIIKLPQVGGLILTRLISQFRRAFKRNGKVSQMRLFYSLRYLDSMAQIVCHSATTFLAHLVNQAVAHEIIALEIAVGSMHEVGAFLVENPPKANGTVYDRFRAVLNEGSISHRVQYMIKVLMQVRKDKYKDNPIIPEGLDPVEEDDQITHQAQLAEELHIQDDLSKLKISHGVTVSLTCVDRYLENEENQRK